MTTYMSIVTVEDFAYALMTQPNFKMDVIDLFTNNRLDYKEEILKTIEGFVNLCNEKEVGEKRFYAFRNALKRFIKKSNLSNEESNNSPTGLPTAT